MNAKVVTKRPYEWLCDKFEMPKHFSQGLFSTGGAVGCAIIDAGYNIGVIAREYSPSGTLEESALERAFAEERKPLDEYEFVHKESHWEEDACYSNIQRVFREHKVLILRVARELWDYFPEIYALYGNDYPGMEPRTFFGLHTYGYVLTRIDQRRGTQTAPSQKRTDN